VPAAIIKATAPKIAPATRAVSVFQIGNPVKPLTTIVRMMPTASPMMNPIEPRTNPRESIVRIRVLRPTEGISIYAISLGLPDRHVLASERG
jgi:hypothetical protein